jgi:secreted trypsin-like serine protease
MNRLLIILSLMQLTSCAPKSNISGKVISSLIINGTDVKTSTTLDSSVVGIYNAKLKGLCTGTLIASNIVLTAAHCVPDRASNVKIVFSTDVDDILSSRELDVLQEYVLPATDFKAGPDWNPKNETVEVNTGDIALIKFKGNIPPGYKPAVFLEDKSALKIGNSVTVMGFGVDFIDTKEIEPKKYHKLDEAIEFGEVVCEDDAYGAHIKCYKVDKSGDGILRTTTAPISFIFETEIQLNEKKSGTCNGDSGGPAFIQKNGELFLFGVTSRGSNLCNEVGVYTNALYYKTWIEETIKILK